MSLLQLIASVLGGQGQQNNQSQPSTPILQQAMGNAANQNQPQGAPQQNQAQPSGSSDPASITGGSRFQTPIMQGLIQSAQDQQNAPAPDPNSALLRLGAGLLGARNLGQGLSQGIANVLDGRNQDRDYVLRKNTAAANAFSSAGILDNADQNLSLRADQQQFNQGMDTRKQDFAEGPQFGLDQQRVGIDAGNLALNRQQLGLNSVLAGLPGSAVQGYMAGDPTALNGVDPTRMMLMKHPAQQGDLYIDPSTGKQYQQTFLPSANQQVFTDLATGQPSPFKPPGAIPASSSALSLTQKNDEDAYSGALDDAKKYIASAPQLSDTLAMIQNNGGTMGKTVGANVARALSPYFSQNAGTLDLLSKNLAGDALNQMSTLHGIGRLDDSARAQINAALPQLSTNPAAAAAVVRTLQAQGGVNQGVVDGWAKATPQQRQQGFRMFDYNYRKANPIPNEVDLTTGQIRGSTQPPAGVNFRVIAPPSSPAQQGGQ